MKTTVEIKDHIYKTLKLKSVQENRKINELMNESLSLYLDISPPKKLQKKQSVLLPILSSKSKKTLFGGMSSEEMHTIFSKESIP
jgi:uridine kinase